MDGKNVETGTPQPIEAQYETVGKLFTQAEQLIPTEGLETFEGGLHGKLVNRQKKFSASTTLVQLRTTLQDRFPEESEQGQIVDAASQFLERVSSNMTPGRDIYTFGQLDRFLSEFPMNMIKRLGNNADAATISKIIQIGSTAYDKEAEELANLEDRYDSLDRELLNRNCGIGSLLVGEAIPEAIANAGEDGQTLLAKFEEAARILPFSEFQDLVEFYQTNTKLSDREKARIKQFKISLKGKGIDIDASRSVFNQDDREPWKPHRLMGRREGSSTWADLGAAVRATEEDNIEYGITIEKTKAAFYRGSEGSIFNGERRANSKDMVFFHAHPSTNREKEVVAPLVSRGDITANMIQDYGGGYLNVVNTSGVTLHVGGEMTDDLAETAMTDNRTSVIYTVESGELKGTRISPKEAHVETLEVMLKLKESGLPYAYSIYDSVMRMKYWFVHIPWEHLNSSADLQGIVFEDGLPKVLEDLEGLPPLPQTKNLAEALDNSSKVLHAASLRNRKERFGEESQI